jgi:hypothetical protein
MTAMQRSKTATDLGALAQAAGAEILTAPVGKRRSNMQHPYAKHNNLHPTPRPIVTSIPVIQYWWWIAEQRDSRVWQELQDHKSWDQVVPITESYEKNCGKTFASADERIANFIQEHGFTSKPATQPLKSSLKNSKGGKVKFVKSQR